MIDKGFLNDFGRKVALYSHVNLKLTREEERIKIWNKRCEFFWRWIPYLIKYNVLIFLLFFVLVHLPLLVLLVFIMKELFKCLLYINYEIVYSVRYLLNTTFLLPVSPYPSFFEIQTVDFINTTQLFWDSIIKTVELSRCNSYFCMYWYWLALNFK